MTDYNDDTERRIVPDHLLPNELKVLGDQYSLPPEQWECETLIHVCHHCGILSRGLGGHMTHSADQHPTCGEHPTATCSALPADEWYWPHDGVAVIEDLQDSLTGGKGAPNGVADIVG